MSVCHIESNRLRITRILSVKKESATVKTFAFKDENCQAAKPGQFLMLWVPGVDEIPLSIMDVDNAGLVSVAVKEVGDATRAFHEKKVGDALGVRGPFGNSFTIEKGRFLLVGGGTGIAPLHFLVRRLKPKAQRLVFILGAKSRGELLYMRKLKEMLTEESEQVILATEDGSCGVTGLCTEPLEKIVAKERFDMVYACGPEKMLMKVFALTRSRKIGMEVSLERLMRCAMGLCGSCTIGKYRVCTDGPVFSSGQLEEVKAEFGVSKFDFDGRRIPVE